PRGEPTPVAARAEDIEIEEEGTEWEGEEQAESATDTEMEVEAEAAPRERKSARTEKPEAGSAVLPRVSWASLGAAIALAIFFLARRVRERVGSREP
ncbi:MAG TPA: hypothetical protein VMT52_09990, partial [Planctomycetota bacterium]|nr:hypothetical protein [Planctomycetota bacterium]